jgi:uncharacterized DUF497 family protein
MGEEISQHARKRIRERGASIGFVRKVVSGEVRRSKMSADRPGRVILTARDFLWRYWSVICNIQCTEVITVRRAHKKEIRNYENRRKTNKGRI